jgi:major membrane immunogen (membrane-anchored lipoprotein)
MNSKMLSRLLIGLILSALLLTGCGSAVKSTFPTGTFIKSGETDYGLKFNPDGTFSVFQGDNTFITGTYKADGKVFTETSNDGGCDTNVSFNYTFDGSKLTLSYAGDPEKDVSCTGRHADFNKVSYRLSK